MFETQSDFEGLYSLSGTKNMGELVLNEKVLKLGPLLPF